MDFPVEILEDILDCLSYNKSSLETCSRVNPTFRTLSQSILFQDVVLHDVPCTKTRQTPSVKLLHVLQSSPHLAGHIRGLNISCHLGNVNSWILHDTTMALVCPRLIHLQKISFFLEDSRATLPAWSRFSPEFQQALCQAFQLPLINQIDLRGVHDFPLSVLYEWKALNKFIAPRDFIYHSSEDLCFTGTEPKIKLDSLTIYRSALKDTSEMLTVPHTPFDLSYIRHLSLECLKQADHEAACLILQEESLENLTQLCLHVGTSADSLFWVKDGVVEPRQTLKLPRFNLINHTHIQTLVVSAHIDNSVRDRYWAPFPWITHLLESLPNRLRRVILEFSFDGSCVSCFEDINWAEFTGVLASQKCYVLLKAKWIKSCGVETPDPVAMLKDNKDLLDLIAIGRLEIIEYE